MSSDILTQLQTCYDQLLTQFFSTISYLSQRHPLVAPEPIPGDPFTNPPEISTADSTGQDATKQSGLQVGPEDTERSIYPLRPASPSTFANAQKELAEDLVRKGQQIEYLISKLPGIGIGEAKQAEEIQILVQQVREMDRIREQKRREMRACVQKLDNVVLVEYNILYERMVGLQEPEIEALMQHLCRVSQRRALQFDDLRDDLPWPDP